ncbi:T9SS sorting signal type C domain-containing protein [Flavobacterium sp. XS2P39]|uniref:T9SS sorting signal type C domain-containing protein n=1 Tax=Flavobacterium sp. XS2P39 TaxID=3401725 RepID=UPI003AACBE04
MIKKLPFTLFLVLLQTVVFAQNTGDFRSAASGNWTALTSWQYYNGTTWVTPSGTSPQGYPGQFAGTYAVLIQTGHTISIGNPGISTEQMGTLTINGQLSLIGENSGAIVFSLKTQAIVVTTGAKINFEDKATLALPTNATIQVGAGGLPVPGGSGDCNNNIQISIGGFVYAYCTGGGSSSNDFEEIMGLGGSGGATVNSPVCVGNSINLSAIPPPKGGPFTYLWSGPGFSSSKQNPDSFIASAGSAGSYSVTMTSTTLTPNKSIVAQATVVVNSATTAPIVGTVTQPTCSLATGGVALSGLPASGTWTLTRSGTSSATTTGTGTSTTISGLPTGTYTYTIFNGSCTSVASSNVVINTSHVAVAPAVTLVQPVCTVSTGTITVTSPSPASGISYTVVGTVPFVASVTSATGVFSGLTPGTYNITTTNSGCISSATSVTINPMPTNTWNGSAWSTGFVPTSSEKIIFNGSFSSTADLVACSCQVNSGAVVINSSHTLSLTNEVVVSGGSLTFENNASLVQSNNNAVNTGNITYKRSNTTTRETDYTYWSSPVLNQTLYDVSQDTPDGTFYSFDAAVDDWVAESSSAHMTKGVGYIIRGPDYGESIPPPGFHEASFIGVPNNGLVEVIIPSSGHETSNLVGNPYPCAVDADSFLTANNAILEGTLYFWTHSTQIGIGVSNPGTGLYAYSSDDYASYNLTGGTGTAGNFIGGVTEQISNKPVGKIAAGQGFFATGKATGGNLIFNNGMRVAGGASGVNNSHFFKMAATKNTSKIQKNRVWLNLTNTQGAFKQALVGYITNATDGYDSGFDGESFDGNEFIDFYSINEDKNLTIQGRALPFDQKDEIPLGYTSNIEGEFSISIDEVDGMLASQNIYIEDKITGVIKNLKEGVYSFTTKPGAFNDRFVMRYTNIEKILGNDDFDILDKTVLVSNKDKQVKINSSAEALDKVEVYDLLGRLVYQKGNIDANELVISNLAINHQVLLFKIELQKGEIITKKISY